jgi:hypothetical protein
VSSLNLSPEPEQAPIVQDNYELESQAKSGANWFYWIAGLSIVNSVIFLAGAEWSFFAGLGITQIIDVLVAAVADGAGMTAIKVIAIVLDVIIAGFFLICGLWANKFHNWAFLAGMIVYLIDGVIVLLLGAWLPAAFHAFALYMIFRGFMAARQLKTV